MKVYIVVKDLGFEGGYSLPVGVYAEKASAEAAAAKANDAVGHYYWDSESEVIECEVNCG